MEWFPQPPRSRPRSRNENPHWPQGQCGFSGSAEPRFLLYASSCGVDECERLVVMTAHRDGVRRARCALHGGVGRDEHPLRVVLPEPDVQIIVPEAGRNDWFMAIHRTGE